MKIWQRITWFVLGLGVGLLIAPNKAHAFQVCWTPPTENMDGTPLTDLAGYVVYFGTGSRSYTESRQLSVGQAVQAGNCYNVRASAGTYYVAMTAFDAENNESAFSNEVMKTEGRLEGPGGGRLVGPSGGTVITRTVNPDGSVTVTREEQ